jgi:hypothetical protein
MTPSRSYAKPPRWSAQELETHRREAIADFIEVRNAEGSVRYRAAFADALDLTKRLFDATDDLAEFRSGAALADDPGLVRVARYLGAPPISGDDLNTLAGANIATRRSLDADLASKAAEVIASAMDPERFGWLFDQGRAPTAIERDVALRWTAGLMAASEAQMSRRNVASGRQEAVVRALLASHGFNEVVAKGIELTGGLSPGTFSREASVVGIRCDVPVGLFDGRLLLIECKSSNSAVNSVKRLNRETGGKAQEWIRRLGERAVPAAVLAGVFQLGSLLAAQEVGTAIFWERDLSPLAEFTSAAK